MRTARLAACLTGLTLLAACSENEAVARAEARTIEPLELDALPAELVGLEVEREDIADVLDAAKRPYLAAASLYSLREGEELQATLQIGRFADDADHEDEDFRSRLLDNIGAGSVQEYQVGGEPVYLTRGDRQQVAVWFQDDHMFVLSTREEFGRSRTLLRRSLEVQL